MYIPKYFKVTNIDEIWDFVQKNSFGTIVTTEQGKPIATHLPLGLNKKGDDYYITGHMAYANPQWKTFEVEDENVPTWNYQSVHVYGTASMMSEQELEEDLILLLQKYESHRKNAALWENSLHKRKNK